MTPQSPGAIDTYCRPQRAQEPGFDDPRMDATGERSKPPEAATFVQELVRLGGALAPLFSLKPPSDLDPPPEPAIARTTLIDVERRPWDPSRPLLDAAAEALERLCLEAPHQELARAALLQLCIVTGRHHRVGVHIAWLVREQLRSQRPVQAFAVYEQVRELLPALALPEPVLVAVLSAADEARIGTVVLDATNMLLEHHPGSSQTAAALLVCARHQFLSGSPGPATLSLRYLIAHYPEHPAAELARRRLIQTAG